MKFNISDDIARNSGIYMIKNTIDRRVYVGKAENMFQRYLQHRASLASGTHSNGLLQFFVNQHCMDCLNFELLEVCNKSQLADREVHYMEEHKSIFHGYGFNIHTNWVDLSKFGSSYKLNTLQVDSIRKKIEDPRTEKIIKTLRQYREMQQLLRSGFREIDEMREHQMKNLQEQIEFYQARLESWKNSYFFMKEHLELIKSSSKRPAVKKTTAVSNQLSLFPDNQNESANATLDKATY